MSQKVTRKSAVSEDKDKKQTENPVKDMKKKMAANAEKEKQAEKSTEKPAEKPEKSKSSDKHDKSAEKVDKGDKGTDKKVEKNGGVAEKVEKKADKKEVEKKDVQEKKEEKGENSGKPEKEKEKKEKPKQNGSHNGFADEAANGNGGSTVSSEDEVMLVIDDHQDDDMFPELTYEDSDAEFEPPTPDGPSRSYTRRSQVKTTRTPETPRPASDKQAEKDNNTDDSKVLKLKEDTPVSTDRKLRSADSPKPESKKQEKGPEKQEKGPEKQEKGQEKQEKGQEKPEKGQEKQEKGQEKQDKGLEKQEKGQEKQEKDLSKDVQEKGEEKENGEKSDSCEVEVVIEVETEEESRKPDTNYSKSRVKVSPYRRSMRIADQTTSSVMANYTGNNTTMEMDITETSLLSQSQDLDDSSYLNTIRNMRGRRSYKKLGELSFKHTARSTPTTSVTEHTSRPTGTVVGRKRKPETDSSIEVGVEAGETSTSAHTKRMRLLDRIAMPFRRTVETTSSLPTRRAAEIVGINTDLPLTAPVATPETFDPETLKAAPLTPPPEVSPELEREKRCIVM